MGNVYPAREARGPPYDPIAFRRRRSSNPGKVETLARQLPEAATTDLVALIESPEVEHIALELATQRMLRSRGDRAADRRTQDTARQFQEVLRLTVRDITEDQRFTLGNLIFELVDASVTASVTTLIGANGDKLPPSTRAALVNPRLLSPPRL